VVVIARNEEEYIAQCLASVLSATSSIPDCRVVFVDSRSTDTTVELAGRFPVEVVRLSKAAPVSRPLARVVGQRLTTGRYILFVDGDTVINEEWLHAAVRVLEEHADVAGVAGKLHEVYYHEGEPVEENPDFFQMDDTVEEAYQLGGNALYRRAALDAIGSFNPYVVSLEEAELAERLRKAGYRLVRLPLRVGTHHTPLRRSLREPWRRFREGLMIGYGQVLRLSLWNGTFWRHARQMNRFLLFTAFEVAGCTLLVTSLLLGDPRYVVGWVLAGVAMLALMVLRSRSLVRPLSVICDWALAGPAILWGFGRQPRDPRGLSLDAVVERRDQPGAAETNQADLPRHA
jgi:glycosyltransferase involved in cell wall biosynthesis